MRVLERMISPRSLELGFEGEAWFQQTAISLAEDKDGHIVGVLIALLMAAATGRMDPAVAGLFGAGKSRAAAVVVIGTLVCKENSAARSFLQLIESLCPPEAVKTLIGRVVSDEEAGHHRLPLDISPARRNEAIRGKSVLIGTGGLFAGELKNRWSVLAQWSEDLVLAFMEEAQQYGAVSEVVVVVRLLHKALLVFGGDKCQTPGGINKSAQGAEMARQKLLTRQHGLRMDSKQLLPTQLASKIRALLMKSNSPLAATLQTALQGEGSHKGLFAEQSSYSLEQLSLAFPQLKCLGGCGAFFLDWTSSVVQAAVVMLVAIQDDSFFEVSMARTNFESAGAVGDFNWHLMLPTRARVSPLTYSAIVATRYVALCSKSREMDHRHVCTRGLQRSAIRLPDGALVCGMEQKGPGLRLCRE